MLVKAIYEVNDKVRTWQERRKFSLFFKVSQQNEALVKILIQAQEHQLKLIEARQEREDKELKANQGISMFSNHCYC